MLYYCLISTDTDTQTREMQRSAGDAPCAAYIGYSILYWYAAVKASNARIMSYCWVLCSPSLKMTSTACAG